jgi:regulator of sigma E protease
MIISIVSAVVVLGILIFVHELGHFLFAKYFGVGVETFSLGFGPKIFAKQIGETEYRISAFPLGGYVKMIGESIDDELPEEDVERSFMAKAPLKRMVIVAAGPCFNLVFAYLVFIIVCMIGVPTSTTQIGEVLADKPAARAGLRAGDRVTVIDGKPVSRWNDLALLISESGGKPVKLTVQRDGKTFSVTVTPEMRTAKNLLGETVTSPAIGVMVSKEFITERVGPLEAVVKGSEHTWNVTKMTVIAVGKIFSGSISVDNIGGPIMIAKTAGEQAETGLVYFLSFMALLSINLGLLNLLPVPILDGGHLVFYLWEMIVGKPVHLRAREIAQQIGLVLLVGLMVLAFYNDIARYLIGQG